MRWILRGVGLALLAAAVLLGLRTMQQMQSDSDSASREKFLTSLAVNAGGFAQALQQERLALSEALRSESKSPYADSAAARAEADARLAAYRAVAATMDKVELDSTTRSGVKGIESQLNDLDAARKEFRDGAGSIASLTPFGTMVTSLLDLIEALTRHVWHNDAGHALHQYADFLWATESASLERLRFEEALATGTFDEKQARDYKTQIGRADTHLKNALKIARPEEQQEYSKRFGSVFEADLNAVRTQVLAQAGQDQFVVDPSAGDLLKERARKLGELCEIVLRPAVGFVEEHKDTSMLDRLLPLRVPAALALLGIVVLLLSLRSAPPAAEPVRVTHAPSPKPVAQRQFIFDGNDEIRGGKQPSFRTIMPGSLDRPVAPAADSEPDVVAVTGEALEVAEQTSSEVSSRLNDALAGFQKATEHLDSVAKQAAPEPPKRRG